jgi:Tfp pilus assembly protein PilF
LAYKPKYKSNQMSISLTRISLVLSLIVLISSCGNNEAVDPFNPEAKALQRSALNLYRTKPDSALAMLDKAAKIDPSFYLVHNTKAMILSSNKRYDKAVAELHQSIAINETQPEVFLQMGLLHDRLAEENRAKSYYSRALEGFSNRQTGGGEFTTQDAVNKAVAMFMLDQPEAIQMMKELMADSPEDPFVQYVCNNNPMCFEGLSKVELLNQLLDRQE